MHHGHVVRCYARAEIRRMPSYPVIIRPATTKRDRVVVNIFFKKKLLLLHLEYVRRSRKKFFLPRAADVTRCTPLKRAER